MNKHILTLTECYCLLLAKPCRQRFQPCQLRKVRFLKCYMYSCVHKRQINVQATKKSRGNCYPRKKFKICASKMPFPAF